jgi:hypothetical protein
MSAPGRQVWTTLQDKPLTRFYPLYAIITLLFSITCCAGDDTRLISVPDVQLRWYKTKLTMDEGPLDEPSGIAPVSWAAGSYWSHNDSGDTPRLFVIRPMEGRIVSEVRVWNAASIDWEDIAAPGDGFIYVADTGNNHSLRMFSHLYILPEPPPGAQEVTADRVTFTFESSLPGIVMPFSRDTEALFVYNDNAWLITKNRFSNVAGLYRLPLQTRFKSDPTGTSDGAAGMSIATYVNSVRLTAPVTGADCSRDGTRLLVLTEKAVWLFTTHRGAGRWFNGSVKWHPADMPWCEAISWHDDKTVMIMNEHGGVFPVLLEDFIDPAAIE